MAPAGCYWWIRKDNERLEIFDHQLKANCQNQRASLATYKKILICCTWRTEKVKDQVQDSIKWVREKNTEFSYTTSLLSQSQDLALGEVRC